VPFVGETFPLAGARKRLAGKACRPNRSVVAPSDAPQREWPSADAGEEVRLDVSFDVVGMDVANVAPIDVAGRQNAICFESIEPVSRVWVGLIVVNSFHAHHSSLAVWSEVWTRPSYVEPFSAVCTGANG
jgi:hypothetical protein